MAVPIWQMAGGQFVSVISERVLKQHKNIRSLSLIGFSVLLLFLALSSLGLLNLLSSAPNQAVIYRQSLALGLGVLTIAGIGWLVPLRLLDYLTPAYATVVIVLLLLVDLIGNIAGGAQRWLAIGDFRFQPSELAKLAVALSVARFFKNRPQIKEFGFQDLAPLAALLGLIFTLIFLQPDFGTAGFCLMIAGFQFLFVNFKRSLIALATLGFGTAAWAGWQFLLLPYQKLRVLNFLNPTLDPSGSGYNSIQSLVAVGSGGVFGKGFMNGTQAQLRFLPERHTDFAFSVFAEEHGFWICLVLFAGFSCFSLLGLSIARRARDTFAQLLAIGMMAGIYLQFVINVAMVLGVFPIVGITLPFFSYGGSSMLSSCVNIGILIAIERDNAGHLRKSYTL